MNWEHRDTVSANPNFPPPRHPGYTRAMALTLSMFGFTFATFCVWLGVRIFNRREKWAKRTAMGLVLVLAYPLSFGPACWLISHVGRGAGFLPTLYWPIVMTMRLGEEKAERWTCGAFAFWEGRPERVRNTPTGSLARLARFGAAPSWRWRYEALYTIDSSRRGDMRIRLGDQAWEWTNRP
jgi:hypothetical protein